ncbi:Dolichyl-phosphate-mannose-protein mannosyltransferase [uncultured archaeon]|nr:Dolichyl-phosphate-mannose-protein mannosyltransferase [uncultured archaeon]
MDRRIFLILLVAFFLRAINLETVPFWQWDEGVNNHIAWNLAHGESRWFALAYRWVPHPPLYFALLGIALRLLGYSIIVGRLFNVGLSIATCYLTYRIGREIDDEKTGLLAAAAYAVSPYAVYWGRLTYSNNLVALLTAASLLMVLEHIRRKSSVALYAASLFSGLAFGAGYNGFAACLALLIVVAKIERNKLIRAAAIMAAPYLVFSAVMLAWDAQGYVHDLDYQFFRFGGGDAFVLHKIVALLFVFYLCGRTRRGESVYMTYAETITKGAAAFWAASTLLFLYPITDSTVLTGLDPYWIGVAGLLWHVSGKKQTAMRWYLFSIILVVLALNRLDHMLIPIQLLLSVGLARAALTVHARTLATLNSKHFAYATAAALIVASLPFAAASIRSSALTQGYGIAKYTPSDDALLAARVQQITKDGDVIVIFPYLDSLFPRTKNTKVLQVISYSGKAIAYYPGDFPKERWLYNVSQDNVRLMILTNGTIQWMKEEPAINDVYEKTSKWKAEDVGRYRVLINPRPVDGSLA